MAIQQSAETQKVLMQVYTCICKNTPISAEQVVAKTGLPSYAVDFAIGQMLRSGVIQCPVTRR